MNECTPRQYPQDVKRDFFLIFLFTHPALFLQEGKKSPKTTHFIFVGLDWLAIQPDAALSPASPRPLLPDATG